MIFLFFHPDADIVSPNPDKPEAKPWNREGAKEIL